MSGYQELTVEQSDSGYRLTSFGTKLFKLLKPMGYFSEEWANIALFDDNV
jgi:hypothetical protein